MGTIEMKRIVERLAQISTVSKSDVQAVLGDLAQVMADYMSLGYTVKIDGLGTFYYTADATGNGVATAEEVDASLITGVRVRFIPESHRSGKGREMVRSLISDNIFWVELPEGTETTDPEAGADEEEGGTDSPGNI